MTLALIPPSVAIVVLARSASGFLGEMTAERTLMTQALRVERAFGDRFAILDKVHRNLDHGLARTDPRCKQPFN